MNLCIFSDFDGTITQHYELDNIVSRIYSYETYKNYEYMLLHKMITYEQYLYDLFEYQNIFRYVDTRKVDPTFKKFYDNINCPFYIISSGFKDFISQYIPYFDSNYIFANNITQYGYIELFDKTKSIDKKSVIESYRKKNPLDKIIFIGDGLSDFSVIDIVDYIFAKENSLLHQRLENLKYTNFRTFRQFSDIKLEELKL